MADLINATEVGSALWQSLPSDVFSGLGFILTLGKIIGIGFIIYIGFLIIESILKIRNALRLKQLVSTLSEINHKMDLLVKKSSGKR